MVSPFSHCFFSKRCYNEYQPFGAASGSDRGAVLRIPRRFGRAADGGRGELPKVLSPPGGRVLGRRRRCAGLSRKWSAIVHRLQSGERSFLICHGQARHLSARSVAFLFFGPLFPARLPGYCIRPTEAAIAAVWRMKVPGKSGTGIFRGRRKDERERIHR